MSLFAKIFGGRHQRVSEANATLADGLEAKTADPIGEDAAQENEAWLRHLATRNPTHRRPGSSIEQERKEWLASRAKQRAAAGVSNTYAEAK